jgi:2'-5' RNA ligase
MYIWLAIDVNEQLYHLRDKTVQLSKQLDSVNTALTLPLHISLRISFCVDDAIYDNVVKTIMEIYMKLSSFEMETSGIEKKENIIWLKIKENNQLKYIHQKVVDILYEEYNVEPHKFDREFLFHTTLFTDDNISKVNEAYKLLYMEEVPLRLVANRLIIGTSKTGLAGEYEVIKIIEI